MKTKPELRGTMTHRALPTWANQENVRTIALFAGMILGTYGVGNTTVGALDREISELRADVRSVTIEIANVREDINRASSAIEDLRAGTVNPSNLSRIVAVTTAISEMDRDNSALWTASGKPRISVIEKRLKASGRLDYKVTSIERDHACAMSDKCRR